MDTTISKIVLLAANPDGSVQCVTGVAPPPFIQSILHDCAPSRHHKYVEDCSELHKSILDMWDKSWNTDRSPDSAERTDDDTLNTMLLFIRSSDGRIIIRSAPYDNEVDKQTRSHQTRSVTFSRGNEVVQSFFRVVARRMFTLDDEEVMDDIIEITRLGGSARHAPVSYPSLEFFGQTRP